MTMNCRTRATLPTALQLLSRLPRASHVARATEAELHHIQVDEARSLRHQTAAPLLRELARTTIGVREGAEALELPQDWLVRTVRELDASIADLELRLAEAVKHFPEARVLASFPSMSPVRIATLLARMGAPVEAFATDRALPIVTRGRGLHPPAYKAARCAP